MSNARLQDTARHETGALSVRFGIACGTVEQFADALDATPSEVLAAIEAAGASLLNDTAEPKPRETHRRPKRPNRRCLAMTRADFARMLVHVGSRGTPDHEPGRAVALADPAGPANSESDSKSMSTREKTANLKVRMPPALMERVERAARCAGRTVSGYVRHVLDGHVPDEEGRPGADKPAEGGQ